MKCMRAKRESKPFPSLSASFSIMTPEPNELELAVRARGGDQAALAELVERLRLGLFALAYAELRHFEDAQDAVAAALHQICCHAVDLRDPNAMRAWMVKIVRNETHRMRRGAAANLVSLDEAAAVGKADPSPLLRLDIERALRKLPQDQAHAVSLFYLREWSIVEIAHQLKRPVGTIKYWLHQGRRSLAREMKGYAPMEHGWRGCIVAPQISTAQHQAITDSLNAGGFADVRTVFEVHTIDDLYHRDISRSDFMTTPGGRIDITDEGKTVRITYQSENRQVQVDGLLSDQSIVRLVEPIAGCDFLILGERIASRSAFEFLPLIRAMAPAMHICLLLDPPVSDYTFLSCFVSGVTKLHTLRGSYSEIDLQNLQFAFNDVRSRLEAERNTS